MDPASRRGGPGSPHPHPGGCRLPPGRAPVCRNRWPQACRNRWPQACRNRWPQACRESVGRALPRPGLSLPRPGLSLPRPGLSLPRPGLSLPRPGLSLPRPGLSLPRPGLSLPRPGLSLPRPGLSLPRPGLSLPRPGLSLPRPGLPSPRVEPSGFGGPGALPRREWSRGGGSGPAKRPFGSTHGAGRGTSRAGASIQRPLRATSARRRRSSISARRSGRSRSAAVIRMTRHPRSSRIWMRLKSARHCPGLLRCRSPSYSTMRRACGHTKSARASHSPSSMMSAFNSGSGSPAARNSNRARVSMGEPLPTLREGKAARSRRTPRCPVRAATASTRSAGPPGHLLSTQSPATTRSNGSNVAPRSHQVSSKPVAGSRRSCVVRRPSRPRCPQTSGRWIGADAVGRIV